MNNLDTFKAFVIDWAGADGVGFAAPFDGTPGFLMASDAFTPSRVKAVHRAAREHGVRLVRERILPKCYHAQPTEGRT